MLAKGHRTFWRLGLLLSWPTVIKTFFIIMFLTSVMRPGVLASGLTGQGSPRASIWLGLSVCFGIVLLTLLHFRSSAILRHAVMGLRDKGTLDMPRVIEQAEPHTVTLLKAGMLFTLAGWAGFVVFAWPVAYLAVGEKQALAAALAGVAAAIFVPSAFVLYVCSIMAPNFTCLRGMTPVKGLHASMDMARRAWPNLLLFTALAWFLEIVGIAASFLAGTAVYAAFVLLFRIFYDMYGLVGPVLAQGLAGTLGFMVFFMSLAWVSAVQRIAWTMLFLETARPAKAEDQPEEEAVAETVT